MSAIEQPRFRPEPDRNPVAYSDILKALRRDCVGRSRRNEELKADVRAALDQVVKQLPPLQRKVLEADILAGGMANSSELSEEFGIPELAVSVLRFKGWHTVQNSIHVLDNRLHWFDLLNEAGVEVHLRSFGDEEKKAFLNSELQTDNIPIRHGEFSIPIEVQSELNLAQKMYGDSFELDESLDPEQISQLECSVNWRTTCRKLGLEILCYGTDSESEGAALPMEIMSQLDGEKVEKTIEVELMDVRYVVVLLFPPLEHGSIIDAQSLAEIALVEKAMIDFER